MCAGVGVLVCGGCVLVVGSLHMPADSVTATRQMGAVASSVGVLVLLLQPTIQLTWYVYATRHLFLRRCCLS